MLGQESNKVRKVEFLVQHKGIYKVKLPRLRLQCSHDIPHMLISFNVFIKSFYITFVSVQQGTSLSATGREVICKRELQA